MSAPIGEIIILIMGSSEIKIRMIETMIVMVMVARLIMTSLMSEMRMLSWMQDVARFATLTLSGMLRATNTD